MNKLALELVEYVKNDVEKNKEIKDLYKSCEYALSDGDFLSSLPERFQDQKVLDEAYEICNIRVTLLDPVADYYNDMIPM